MIVEYHLNLDSDLLTVILSSGTDFFRSFSNDYLGFQIGFGTIPLIIGLFVPLLAGFVGVYGFTKRNNYKVGEEHGSARYGNIETEANYLKDDVADNNMIFSKHIHISMNTRKTFLNNNVLVIGGSGSGKTRYIVKPNVLQMNCNYIITDPKGSLLPEIANAFEENDYDIKILNLVDMTKSMHYNPFDYIYKPNDVYKFINNLVENTTKQNSNAGGDEFFVKAEIAFLTALVFFIMAKGQDDERNIGEVMELIDLAEASEEDENAVSTLDAMFDMLKQHNELKKTLGILDKNSYSFLAERQYNLYKKAAGKTAKSILISVGVRMSIFNIPEVKDLLSNDELELRTLGEPKTRNGKLVKTALFVIISDSDSTFSFIASILYQQLYDMLYMIADARNGGRLPIHTRFIQDEFVNTGKQKDFEVKIATMRSREISVMVILQNLAQLKNLYKDSWETIFGNCDTTIFLGGKEPSTTEYLSKLVGNTTIDYNSISETKGSNWSYSTSNQLIQRPLISPDEMSRLKPDECLVHIRGQHIFRDKKYRLEDHERINLTTDATDKTLAKNNRYNSDKLLFNKRQNKLDFTLDKQAQENVPEIAGTLDDRGCIATHISSVKVEELQAQIEQIKS